MVCDAYGDTVDYVAPVISRSGVFSLFEDDGNLADIPLSKDADVCTVSVSTLRLFRCDVVN